jgi:hypothetical protein
LIADSNHSRLITSQNLRRRTRHCNKKSDAVISEAVNNTVYLDGKSAENTLFSIFSVIRVNDQSTMPREEFACRLLQRRSLIVALSSVENRRNGRASATALYCRAKSMAARL